MLLLFIVISGFYMRGLLCVSLAVLELRDQPTSTSVVLGLKACTTTVCLYLNIAYSQTHLIKRKVFDIKVYTCSSMSLLLVTM